MIDDRAPAINQPTVKDSNGRCMFSCVWNKKRRTENFTQWAHLTGVPRNTIKTRYYQDRSARECLGIDKIISKPRHMKPRTSKASRERRQVEIAKQFLCARW